MHGIMSRVKGVFVVKRQLEGPESRSLTPDAVRTRIWQERPLPQQDEGQPVNQGTWAYS